MKRIKVKDRDELIKLIKSTIYKKGIGADLNFIDTSEVKDFSCLFECTNPEAIKVGILGTIRSISSFLKNLYRKYILRINTADLWDIRINISKWDLSGAIDLGRLFWNSPFNGDISGWNTSKVEDMSYMFDESQFNGDISKWNTGNVTTMEGMFSGSCFNGDISKWNTSRVTDMEYMFHDSLFNGDISDWNVEKVKYMSSMFLHSPFNQPIGRWNTGNVINMNCMFCDSQFNQDISEWNVENVRNMGCMFNSSPFNRDIGGWNITNICETTSMSLFDENTKYNHNLGRWKRLRPDLELEKYIKADLLVYNPFTKWIDYDNRKQ